MIAFEGVYLSLTAGLMYGLVISLLGIGMSLIYGIMRSVNVAHGSFYMLAAYAAFGGAFSLKFSPILASAFGVAATTLIGVAVFNIIPTRWRVTTDPDSQNKVAILFMGIALIFQQGIFLIFGGSTIPVSPLIKGIALLPGGASFTYQMLISAVISAIAYVFLYVFIFRTKTGRAIRAFSQDRETAEAMGVNVKTLVMIVFAIGTLLAAMSGVLLSAQYTASPDTGWDQLMIAFIIVTLGGIGSLAGTLFASLIYGVAYQIAQFYVPEFSFVIVVLLIYFIIVLKPTGLMSKVVERD